MILLNLTLLNATFGRVGLNFNTWSIKSFFEHLKLSYNLIPFKTIIKYIYWYIHGSVSLRYFIINIFGNIIAFMPFALFAPILFPKVDNIKKFITTLFCIVLLIELLQIITLSGFFDIDDFILNIGGAYIMYKILELSKLNSSIKRLFIK
jgi:glycopeptide antibiotics resistance protein